MGGILDMNELSAIWLEEIAEGSTAAFSRFYDAYHRLVYRLALQITKETAEAEDLCQDIFMEVLHKADQYDPARGSVEAWLAVRTRCRAMDRLRKRQRIISAEWTEEEVLEEIWSVERESVELAALRRVELEQVKRALQAIPPLQRMAVYGSYVEQRTHREIAELLNRPVGTVKSLIRYGLQNVRKLLDTKNGKEGGSSQHETIKSRT